MRLVALLVLSAAVLGGCSLFGPEVETLDTTTLFQTDTLATESNLSGRIGEIGFLVAPEEETSFRDRYGIDEPFGVDYATANLAYVVAQTAGADGRVDITSVELIGDDRAKVTYVATGITAPTDSVTTRYPLHVVRVRRIADLRSRTILGEGSSPAE